MPSRCLKRQVTSSFQHADKTRFVDLAKARETSMLVLPSDVVSVGPAEKAILLCRR